MRRLGLTWVLGLVACAGSPEATSPEDGRVAPVGTGVAAVDSAAPADVASLDLAGIDSETASAAIDAAQERAAAVDSGTAPAAEDDEDDPPYVVLGQDELEDPELPDADDPPSLAILELPSAPGEPLPWPVQLEGRELSYALRPVATSAAAASSATSAPASSVIRVRVSWRVEPDRDYGFDPVSDHVACAVDAFASPPLVAAVTRFAAARLRWGKPTPAAEGGVSVSPDRSLVTTLRATSSDTPAETGRVLLQVLPDPEDPRRLELGLEVHGPGPTGAQVHEFVRLKSGPPGASCRLWLPDLLAGGRRDLGGFELTVEVLGYGTPESIPPPSLPTVPDGPEAPEGPPPIPLDLDPPRRALLEAGSEHPLLLDLALSAPANWVRELVESLETPTPVALARAAWERLCDPDAERWTRALCDRHAGALALRPARLRALLLDHEEPAAWRQAIHDQNAELLQDSQAEVRVRAARFLGAEVPADYDPYRRRAR